MVFDQVLVEKLVLDERPTGISSAINILMETNDQEALDAKLTRRAFAWGSRILVSVVSSLLINTNLQKDHACECTYRSVIVC